MKTIETSLVSFGCQIQRIRRLIIQRIRRWIIQRIRQPTIPLLELMAASLGVDMTTSISRVFSANGVKVRITFWGDNQAVLYQIHQEEQHKDKIVENRTKKIKLFNEASGAKWRYVPADSNPADLLTRGISLEQFQPSNLWKFGPSWLTNPEEWPVWNMENQKSVAV